MLSWEQAVWINISNYAEHPSMRPAVPHHNDRKDQYNFFNLQSGFFPSAPNSREGIITCCLSCLRPRAPQIYLDVPQLEKKTETVELEDPPWAVKLLLCLPHFLHQAHHHSIPSHHLQSYEDAHWSLGLSGPAQHKDTELIPQAVSRADFVRRNSTRTSLGSIICHGVWLFYWNK